MDLSGGDGTRLVVMLKCPEPGKVKTRLVPPLTEGEAARLYRCFIEDTLLRLQPLALSDDPATRLTIYVAFAPPERRAAVAAIVPAGTPLIPQQGRDLGERLHRVFSEALRGGAARVVVIGSDSPDIPLASIREAVSLLRTRRERVVLGPSEDGGYYLIAMARAYGEPFESISWGGEAVMAETLERCQRAGIEVALLPRWRDVDRVEDLEPLVDNDSLPATNRFIKGELDHIIRGKGAFPSTTEAN